MNPEMNALAMTQRPKTSDTVWSTPQAEHGAPSVMPLETQPPLSGELMVFGLELNQENAHIPSMSVNDQSSEIHLKSFLEYLI